MRPPAGPALRRATATTGRRPPELVSRLEAAGDEGEGVDAATSARPPGPRLFPGTGLEPARCSWEPGSGVSPLASRDAGPGPAPRLPRSRCARPTRSVNGPPEPVSYTHLRAHETGRNLVCRLL